jgi:hypothetical protein
MEMEKGKWKSARGRGKKNLTQRRRVRRDSAGEHKESRREGQEEDRWRIEREILRLAKLAPRQERGKQHDYPCRIVSLAEHRVATL